MNKDDTEEVVSKLDSPEGKDELYLYSLRKMADSNINADIEPLAGILGNKAFYFRANEVLRQFTDRKYAIIRMDIYRFKTVNEFCGRKEGDKIISFLGRCFKEYEREDVVVAHLRADIFVMLIPYEDRQELIDIVNDIKRKIDCYDIACRILPSFGICEGEPNMDASLMSDYADLALKKIKGKVFSYYKFYEKHMRHKMMKEKQIENQILDAISTHEIQPFIQPKVDMRDGHIIGGEALVRWIKADGKMIFPDEFIPVLEKSGYVIDVDQFMWEQIFMIIRKLMDEGIKVVPISINVSRMHAYQHDLADFLINMSKMYKVPPELVPLEVTESTLTEMEELFFENIHKLQDFGFRISMDDFGSGYSSLNMLKAQTVNEIKIDKVFIDDMDNHKCKIVVRNIIHMLKDLELEVIVEGVETQDQVNFLLGNGCYRAQGYFYHKPMPVDDFIGLLEKNVE